MTATPTWSPTDPDTGAILDLMGLPTLPSHDDEWAWYVAALHAVANHEGRIDPNRLRRLTRGRIKPCRVGALTRKAICAGLVTYDGTHVESDDLESRNAGKPIRVMRLAD